MKHLTTSETRHYCTGQSTQKIYLKIEIERDQEALRREAYDNFLKSEKKKTTPSLRKTIHIAVRREPHSPKMEKEENGRGKRETSSKMFSLTPFHLGGTK